MVAKTLLCIENNFGVSIPKIEASSLQDLQSDF